MSTPHFVIRCLLGLLLVPLSALSGGCKGEESDSKAGTEPGEGRAAATDASPGESDATQEWVLPEIDETELPIGLQMKIAAARTVLRRSPDDVPRVVDLGSLCHAHGFPQAAVACFRQATRLAPDDVAWWYCLGLAAERAGKPAQAEAAYEKALALNEEYQPTRIRLAALLLGKDRDRAAELLRGVLEKQGDPNHAVAHFGLGLCARAAEQQDEAGQHFREALNIAPDYGPAHAGLAALLSAQGKPEEAAEHRRQSSDDERLLPSADPVEEVLLLRGLDLETLLQSARGLAKLRQFARAERVLEDALVVEESGVRTRNTLGQILGMQERFEEAIREFERVLSTPEGKDFAQAKVHLAIVLTRVNEYERAESLLREVLGQHPDDIGVLETFCRLAAEQNTPDKALPLLSAAVAAAPDNAVTHYQVGELLLRLGKQAEGCEALRKAVELQPSLAPARYTLGVLLYRSGDTAGARQQWTEALRVAPRNVTIRLTLAEALRAEKEYEAAERCLREGLEQVPEPPDLANSLAWLLATCPDADRRKPEEAVEWAEKAAEATKHAVHSALDTLAAAHAAAGRFDDARKWIVEAIKLAQATNDAQAVGDYRRREALYEAGRPYYQSE